MNEIKLKIKERPEISYEDVLAKLGVTMIAGKLLKAPSETVPVQSPIQMKVQPQNNYIYNKYFNEPEIQTPIILKPQSIKEYKDMLIKKIIDDANRRAHVNQIKSKKLLIPGNINISNRANPELNKIFKFMGRR
jgi:hypothetical protein